MNLKLYISTLVLLQFCTAQDYGTPTYNPDINQPSPTNEYLSNNDPRYDNPYDPNKRYSSRNNVNQYNSGKQFDQSPYNTNQYDTNQNQYDPNRSQYDRNNPSYQNPYTPENTPRPAWDSGRTYNSGSFKTPVLDSDNLIINEA